MYIPKPALYTLAVALLVAFLFGAYHLGTRSNKADVIDMVATTTPVISTTTQAAPTQGSTNKPSAGVPDVTKVNVDMYNVRGRTFSIQVPTLAFTSTCIWTYTGGNHAIPYSETTTTETPRSHVLGPFDDGSNLYDFAVTCVDELGRKFQGVFPPNSDMF
jgi:hypothetical protein